MHTWSGYGMGWGMGLMMLMWLVIVLVIGTIWLRSARSLWPTRDVAKAVLRERYARGEIDGDAFQRMLAQLGDRDVRLSPTED
jgi:putative membrane protein